MDITTIQIINNTFAVAMIVLFIVSAFKRNDMYRSNAVLGFGVFGLVGILSTSFGLLTFIYVMNLAIGLLEAKKRFLDV